MYRAGTITEPPSAIRLRSLRTMSTIIVFSARSFSERDKWAAARLSNSGSGWRPIVPFMGREVRRRPSRRMNISGDAEQTAWSPRSR